MAPRAPVVLPAEIEVLVLAEFIRHPRAEPEHLAKEVSSKAGLRIEANQVRALFERHGLKKRCCRRHRRPDPTQRTTVSGNTADGVLSTGAGGRLSLPAKKVLLRRAAEGKKDANQAGR
jgi:hypothetical protein